jgi:hypothetical protein
MPYANLTVVRDVLCADRLKHADAVTKARRALYEAKVLQDQMRVQGIYVERYDSLFNLAKAIADEAVKALRGHRKEHGC